MRNYIKEHWIDLMLIGAIIISLILGISLYQKNKEYELSITNSYNYSFYELLNYVDSMETYLAKSTISVSSKHGAETLTYVWREANLAENCLSQIPLDNSGLSNAAKFLNQVSDYSYALSRKNIKDEELSEEDLKNLEELHEYSVQLKNTLNELSNELNDGTLNWSDLTKKNNIELTQQVSNVTKDSFNNIEGTFDNYTGLIYDGAFSEHMTSFERKGLIGEDISEEKARGIVEEFIGKEKITEINQNGLSENGNIVSYGYNVNINGNENINIAISKKGGHVVYMDSNRNIENEQITEEEADKRAIDFLIEKGFDNMKKTYYLKQNGIITINYAYNQNNIICYPDLIKVKVALDDGDIIGMEATGYLNCHTDRKLSDNIINSEIARKKINKNLEINSTRLAIIPTEYQTEIFCWEFQGKVNDNEFLVYINAENGEEEDIQVIVNTPNGTLTT